jgi:glycosyl transferase family 1
MTTLDVLLVSAGITTGWRGSPHALGEAFAQAGARTIVADTGALREVRTFMLTDLVQAAAARRAAAAAIAEHRPRAVVYCSVTAALLWPSPGAIWLDALAAENRPGRHGVWQRRVERRRVASASLLMTMGPSAQTLAPLDGAPHADAVVVPVPIEASGAPAPRRDVDVLAYVRDPVKRRLDLILAAWDRARREGETMVVAGIDRSPAPAGVRFAGLLAPDAYRALQRRSRVFVTAPRREDFGIAALEALADGAMLVTTPSPGAYPALALARRLDPRLVSDDLATAVRCALDEPAAGYAERATELVRPFGRAAVAATLSERVLPRLLPGWRA